jgi:hypothetical protein
MMRSKTFKGGAILLFFIFLIASAFASINVLIEVPTTPQPTPNLQQVTDIGENTTKNVKVAKLFTGTPTTFGASNYQFNAELWGNDTLGTARGILMSNNALNNTGKTIIMGIPQYTINNPFFAILRASADNTANTISYGGGISGTTVPTLIEFSMGQTITETTGRRIIQMNQFGMSFSSWGYGTSAKIPTATQPFYFRDLQTGSDVSISLENRGNNNINTTASFRFLLGTSGFGIANMHNAGRIATQPTSAWSTTASTNNADIVIYTVASRIEAEALRIGSNKNVAVAGTLTIGNNTATDLQQGDINASTIYYDVLSAKSPPILCDTHLSKCAVFDMEKEKIEYIVIDENYNILSDKSKLDTKITHKFEKLKVEKETKKLEQNCSQISPYHEPINAECVLNEQKQCEDSPYSFWNTKTQTCTENSMHKCIIYGNIWNEKTERCEEHPRTQCEIQGKDYDENKQQCYIKSHEEIYREQRIQCMKDKTKIWTSRGCINA